MARTTEEEGPTVELLFPEEVSKGAPSVFRAHGGGRRSGLDRHAERKKGALVASVLVGDVLRDGLRTLKPVAGIEVGALLAGMQFRLAVGTLNARVG
ncbi:MAG: hypothetical protein AAB222_01585 [Candidatus Binatota bacterium]